MTDHIRTIARPAADVYAYLTNLNHLTEWVPRLTAVKSDSAEPQTGDVIQTQAGSIQATWTFVALNPNKKIAYNIATPFGEIQVYIHLEEIEPNLTRLIKGNDFQFNLLGRLLSPLIHYFGNRQVKEEMDLIKHHLETNS